MGAHREDLRREARPVSARREARPRPPVGGRREGPGRGLAADVPRETGAGRPRHVRRRRRDAREAHRRRAPATRSSRPRAMIDALGGDGRIVAGIGRRRSAACAPASRCVPASRSPTIADGRGAAPRACAKRRRSTSPTPSGPRPASTSSGCSTGSACSATVRREAAHVTRTARRRCASSRTTACPARSAARRPPRSSTRAGVVLAGCCRRVRARDGLHGGGVRERRVAVVGNAFVEWLSGARAAGLRHDGGFEA